MLRLPRVPNFFSIDLEDWFHLLDDPATPGFARWPSLESRVRANVDVLLAELERHGVKCTFFVLGWVAQHHPELVKEISEAGHEIASHGYAHELVYRQGRDAFRDDVRRGSEVIAAACGQVPRGYRAPGFSITPESEWALDVLAEEGFEYDSSVFPAPRNHGGLPGADPLPSKLPNGLLEFPISTVDLRFTRVAYLGGGYLRLLPKPLILRWARSQERAGTPLVLYLHPRDIDPGQPRLPQKPLRYARTYLGLTRSLAKVSALLEGFRWTSFRTHLDEAA